VSVDYSLQLATSLGEDEVRRRLLELLGGELRQGRFVSRGGLWASVGASLPRSAEVIRETFGVTPTVDALYSLRALDEDDRYERDLRDLVHSAVSLALLDDGDAVLLLDHEKLIFRRRAGRLVLNSDWSPWRTVGIADALGVPHELAPLASPPL
jgi:hypothetical protein